MFGVCSVNITWGYEESGGDGSRTTRHWYDGQHWVETPVHTGPFKTYWDAHNFRLTLDKVARMSCFIYMGDDPYGERHTEKELLWDAVPTSKDLPEATWE
jgi:hypothetical protein